MTPVLGCAWEVAAEKEWPTTHRSGGESGASTTVRRALHAIHVERRRICATTQLRRALIVIFTRRRAWGRQHAGMAGRWRCRAQRTAPRGRVGRDAGHRGVGSGCGRCRLRDCGSRSDCGQALCPGPGRVRRTRTASRVGTRRPSWHGSCSRSVCHATGLARPWQLSLPQPCLGAGPKGSAPFFVARSRRCVVCPALRGSRAFGGRNAAKAPCACQGLPFAK
jgi:hypothetical protein